MAEREGRYGRRGLLAVSAIATGFLAEAVNLVPVLRGSLQDYLGIQDGAFGILLSVASVTGFLAVLFGGTLVDRWGAGRVLRLAAVGVAAGLTLMALAGRRYGWVALGLGVTGLFGRPLAVAASCCLVRLFPEQQRRVLSVNLAVIALGGVAVPALAEGLLGLSGGPGGISFAWVFHGPLALAAVLLLAAGLPHSGRFDEVSSAAAGSSWHWRELVLPRGALLLCVLAGVHGAVDGTLYLWMARFLGGDSFGCRPLAPGLVLSAFSLGYAVSRAGLALVPERHGRRALLVWPGLLGGAVLLAGLWSRSYVGTAAGFVLGGLLWSLEYPAFISTLAHCEPRRYGAALALSQVLSCVLCVVGVNAMGFAAAQGGDAAMWRVLVALACFFPCLGIGGALWLWSHGHQLAPEWRREGG
jgi:MFS family permease